MDRRRFLGMLGASAAALATFDVERWLWVPGQKTIFLPSPPSLQTQFAFGDFITIAGKFAINPITGQETNHLQYFMVTDVQSTSFGLHPWIDDDRAVVTVFHLHEQRCPERGKPFRLHNGRALAVTRRHRAVPRRRYT